MKSTNAVFLYVIVCENSDVIYNVHILYTFIREKKRYFSIFLKENNYEL